MTWLVNIFGTSDYLERDPYRKLTVGISHAWLGGFLVIVGIPIALIVIGYIVKEVVFDLRGKFGNKALLADSAVDLVLTWLGGLLAASHDWRYGVGVLAVGAAYFMAEKCCARY